MRHVCTAEILADFAVHWDTDYEAQYSMRLIRFLFSNMVSVRKPHGISDIPLILQGISEELSATWIATDKLWHKSPLNIMGYFVQMDFWAESMRISVQNQRTFHTENYISHICGQWKQQMDDMN